MKTSKERAGEKKKRKQETNSEEAVSCLTDSEEAVSCPMVVQGEA